MSEFQLTAYNVKTKEKNVPIHDAVVTKTAKGALGRSDENQIEKLIENEPGEEDNVY